MAILIAAVYRLQLLTEEKAPAGHMITRVSFPSVSFPSATVSPDSAEEIVLTNAD